MSIFDRSQLQWVVGRLDERPPTPESRQIAYWAYDTGEEFYCDGNMQWVSPGGLTNVGSGAALYKTGGQIRSVIGGTNVNVTQNADDITIDATDTGEANTNSNAGSGAGLVLPKVGVDTPVKSLTAGTGIQLTENANDIEIASTVVPGESNTGANLGASGSEVYAGMSGTALQFRRLTAGNNVTLTQNANDIEIAASASGGGSVIDITITAGEALAKGDFVSVNPSNGRAYKTDIADTGSSVSGGFVYGLRGLVVDTSIASGASGTMRVDGVLDGFSGLTVGEGQWATTTNGGLGARPAATTTQRCIVRAGYAVSPTEIMIQKSPRRFSRYQFLSNMASFTINFPAVAEQFPFPYRIYASNAYNISGNYQEDPATNTLGTGAYINVFFQKRESDGFFQNRQGAARDILGVVEFD